MAKMLAQEAFCLVRVSFPNSRNNVGVFVFWTAGYTPCAKQSDDQRSPGDEFTENAYQHGIAAGLCNLDMKFARQADYLGPVTALSRLMFQSNMVLQRVDIRWFRRACCGPHDSGFQYLASAEYVASLLCIRPGDKGTSVGMQFHYSLIGKKKKRLPDPHPSDPEALTQFCFVQLDARRQPLLHNGGHDPLDDVVLTQP